MAAGARVETMTSAAQERVELGDASPLTLSLTSLLVSWVVSVSASVIGFTWAVTQPKIIPEFMAAFGAAFLGMLAVFCFLYLIAKYFAVFRVSWQAAAIGASFFLGGTAAALWGADRESQFVVGLAGVVAVHAGALLSDSFNQLLSLSSNRATAPARSVRSALVALVVATIGLAGQRDFAVAAAFFSVVWLLSLVALKLSIVQYAFSDKADDLPRRSRRAWFVSVGSIAAGLVVLAVGGNRSTVIAGTLLVGGLSVLGLLIHNDVPRPRLRRRAGPSAAPAVSRTAQHKSTRFIVGLAGAAVLCFGASVMILSGLTGSWFAGILVVSTLLVVGAFFVLPGEAIFGAVLIALIVTWVAGDSDSADAAADNAAVQATFDDGEPGWVVAIGDSFISGEGAPGFYAGTNSPGENECRRAPTAYSRLVGAAKGLQVKSFACSGATTVNLRTEGQHSSSPDGVSGALPQLTEFTSWLNTSPKPKVELVLLSIGGNDSGFTDVIVACLTPGTDCSEAERPFLDRTATLGTELIRVYRELDGILLTAQVDVPVLVTPYPDPLGSDDPTRCSLMLSIEETNFVRRFRRSLNEEVRTAVDAVGRVRMVRSHEALAGHELCTSNAYVNWLRLTPPDGSLARSANPINWKNGSLHPGVGGHCVTALFVLETIAAGLADGTIDAGGLSRADERGGMDCSLPTRPTSAPPARADLELPESCRAVGPDGTDLVGGPCTEEFLAAGFSNAISRGTFAAILAFAAGVFLAGAGSGFNSARQKKTKEHRIWDTWLGYDRVAGGRTAESGETADVLAKREAEARRSMSAS